MIDTSKSESKSWRPASIALAAALTLALFNTAACTSANARNTSMPDDISIPVDTSVPSAKVLQGVVDEAHAKYKGLKDGKNADYIPILATIPSELFGVVIVMRDGTTYKAGDVDYAFAIESTSKPFTAALVMEQNGGPQILVDKIGVEPTGLPFNSKLAIEILKARSVNPLVNAGAMASVSLVKASSEQERWDLVLGNLSDFAGAPLTMMEEVYQSEYTTAWSNRGIVNLLYNDKRLYADPEETLRVYTRQCSVGVTTEQLGMMGATLANGGVNPKTGKRLIDESSVPELLAIMLTAGFYDESGYWSMWAGLPSKTGVGGGVVSIVPGKFAIAAFSPRLNEAGNSVRAQKAIQHIAGKLGVGIFGPNPN
jgi:glutaminase